MKVYCNDCIYLDGTVGIYRGRLDTEYKCKSPNNVKTKDTWKEILYFYPLKPKKKNKNNTCDWYCAKETKITIPLRNPNKERKYVGGKRV